MKKLVKCLALILCLVMLFSACGSTTKEPAASDTSSTPSTAAEAEANTPSASTKDTLTVAIANEPPNLDPHNNTALSSMTVEENVYDRLITKDADGNLMPMLAESWEELSDCKIRFYLRDDVYFHNGEKMTANDVKYSISRAEVSNGSKSFFGYFDGESCEVIDDYTIDIVTYEPFAPIYNYLASPRGAILCQSYVESVGDDVASREPVGTGPFKFVSWTTGDSLVFETNKDYWGSVPAYDKLVFRFITEQTSRAIEIQTGGVDIAFNISIDDVPTLEDAGAAVQICDSYATVAIGFNYNVYPEVADQRVREALAHALDVESIVTAVYGDAAAPADSVFSSAIWGHVSVGPVEYNPELAKALLDEAGWDYNTELEVVISEDNKISSIVEIAQNMWREIGLNVSVSSVDSATHNEMTASPGIMISVYSSNATTGDPDHGVFNLTRQRNFHTNEEVFDLVDAGKTTFDLEERAAIYAELQQVAWDDYSLIPIAFTKAIYGVGADVENFVAHPGYIPTLASVTFN